MTDLPTSDAVFRADRAALANTGASDIGLFAFPPAALGVAAPAYARPLSMGEDRDLSDVFAMALPASAAFAPGNVGIIGFSPANAAPANLVSVSAPTSDPGAAPSAAALHAAEPYSVMDAPGSGTTIEFAAMRIAVAPDQSKSPGSAFSKPVGPADTASASSALPIDQAIESVRASADQLNAALASLAEQVNATTPAAAPAVLSAVEAQAASLTAQANAIVATTADRTDVILDGAGQSLAALSDDASALIADAVVSATSLIPAATAQATTLVASAIGPASALIDSATDTADLLVAQAIAPLPDVAATIDVLTASLGDSADGAVANLAPAVADDLLTGTLDGTNPAAGFATLTALLQQDQAFELRDPESDALIFAPVAAASTALDTAIDTADVAAVDVADVVTTPLLGIVDDDGGLLGGLGLYQDDAHG